MPRVGKVQVHTDGRTSESAKLMNWRTLATSRSVVPLSWLLATGRREEGVVWTQGSGVQERGGRGGGGVDTGEWCTGEGGGVVWTQGSGVQERGGGGGRGGR